jgi:hypothetical protein
MQTSPARRAAHLLGLIDPAAAIQQDAIALSRSTSGRTSNPVGLSALFSICNFTRAY